MKLVVGLGNPGRSYHFTRHNIGFLALDTFLSQHDVKATKKYPHSLGVSFNVGGEECLFIKPETFMNRSGEAVVSVAKKVGAIPEDTLILHDEADFDPERIALKRGGGTAGHNGLESIVDLWGTKDFWRLRIGVGKSADRQLADYVLEAVEPSVLLPTQEKAAQALELIFSKGITAAMAEINAKDLATL